MDDPSSPSGTGMRPVSLPTSSDVDENVDALSIHHEEESWAESMRISSSDEEILADDAGSDCDEKSARYGYGSPGERATTATGSFFFWR